MRKREILDTREIRVCFRKYLFKKSKPAYSMELYKSLIFFSFHSLMKYYGSLSKFSGRNEFRNMRNIYNYVRRNKKKVMEKFLGYVSGKTFLSYDVNRNPNYLKKKIEKKKLLDYWENRTEKVANKYKFEEFLIIILAQYVVLHNYMWASGTKMPQIKTIDRFLVDISERERWEIGKCMITEKDKFSV